MIDDPSQSTVLEKESRLELQSASLLTLALQLQEVRRIEAHFHHRAIAIELEIEGIPFEIEKGYEITYRGHWL